MGIFKKASKAANKAAQQQQDLETQSELVGILESCEMLDDDEEDSMLGEVNSSMTTPRTVVSRGGGFFSSGKKNGRRVHKRRKDFRRLSPGCATPENVYEPPNGAVFFPPEAEGQQRKDDDNYEQELEDTLSADTVPSFGSINRHERETPILNQQSPTKQVILRTRGGGLAKKKEFSFRLAKHAAVAKESAKNHIHNGSNKLTSPNNNNKSRFHKLGDEVAMAAASSKTPPRKGFQHLKGDDESISTLAPPSAVQNDVESVIPPCIVDPELYAEASVARVRHSGLLEQASEEQTLAYEPPKFDLRFDHHQHEEQTQYSSDVTEPTNSADEFNPGKSAAEDAELQGNKPHIGTNMVKDVDPHGVEIPHGHTAMSFEGSSSDESGGQKFSERGSAEFRQFVFDKQFSRIETVSVEKSDSGVGDSFIDAAARLASKLKGTATTTTTTTLDRSPRPAIPRKPKDPDNIPIPPRALPIKMSEKDTTPRLSLVSVTSGFPSPTFPSPKPIKLSTRPNKTNDKVITPTRETRKATNKVGSTDEESECIQTAVSKRLPKAIETSCEFTVVSGMSATHATTETCEMTDKSSLPHQPFMIPENKGVEEENDPFHIGVLTEVDDTQWEADKNPFEIGDRTKLKYQGGQLRKSSSADDALISSIRKASSKRDLNEKKKPDPSPRAIKVSKSDGCPTGSSSKFVFEEVRDRSAKKKTSPARDKDGAATPKKLFCDVDTMTSTHASTSIVDFEEKFLGASVNQPETPTTSDVSVTEKVLKKPDTPMSSGSVAEKVRQVERRLSTIVPFPALNSPRVRGTPPPPPPLPEDAQVRHPLGISPMKSPRLNRGPNLPLSPSSVHNRKSTSASPAASKLPKHMMDFTKIFTDTMEPAPVSPKTDELEEQEGDGTPRSLDSELHRLEPYSLHHGARSRIQSQPVGLEGFDMHMHGEDEDHMTAVTNPSGVPLSAIAASMLFHAEHSENARDRSPRVSDASELGDVPPFRAVNVNDLSDNVSSITEEASTFYQKSFQMWSKTAHNALNNLHRGGLTRNQNHYHVPTNGYFAQSYH